MMTNKGKELEEKLKSKLREIFQFESEDLDFGIYRIMNYKRKEIERFIDKELIREIEKQLQIVSEEERIEIEDQLREISSKNGVKKYLEALEKKDEERARIYREDFAKDIKEYERLKKQLEEIRISEELEKEIYNHLIIFFSRYYDNGDFISKRRYGKNEKYVVPYNGEEILLYWVNKDQYYVKTTEYFRKYTFRVSEESLTVNFRVVDAEEEKGNVKAQEKKFFVLNENVFDFDKDKRELNIYFEYRDLTDEEKEKYRQGQSASQDKINEGIIETLQNKFEEKFKKLFDTTDKGKEDYKKYYIGRHLYRYTRRNTTDYFIHKNLKGFLKRELDFYIKNEFLQLEDLQVLEQSGYFDKLRLYLIGVRAFRKIALKIIEFLAQIENFQKKIWEKKKFVIDTHYVITLDKIKEYGGEKFLESILDEILSNEKQIEEWKELFGIEVKKKEDLIENGGQLQLEGKEWRKLPIDTKHFDEEFKWKLLVALSENNDLDEILDGVLTKSENYQALNLLLNKYYERVQTIYIDPPFNKEQEADYLYKVGYKDATWITMLENRIKLGRDLLSERGSNFVRCDYNGNMYVRLLLNEIFGEENFRNEIIVNRVKKTTSENANRLTIDYDNLYLYSKENFTFLTLPKKSITRTTQWHSADTQGRYEARNFFGIELYPPTKNRGWFSQRKIDELINKKELRIVCRNCGYIHQEGILEEKFCPKCKSFNWRVEYLMKPKEYYYIGNNWLDISGYTHNWNFQTENSEILLKRVIESTSNEGDLVMDFFLGSGTTTAVAHKLGRKWIGVEMGEHFYSVVLPRMKKVLHYDPSQISKEKDVKEKYNPKTAGGFFKYHTLEQYEDALENIEFEEPQKELYEFNDYFVKYMLEWETKKSKTFLNIDELKDPFNYKLKIIENYQQKVVNADIVETFNYLLGLNVNGYKVLEDNGRKYVFVFGEKEGKRTAVVWRNIKDINFEKDKEIIENHIKDLNPDEIYINGDAVITNFKPIEPEFKSLMFNRVD